MTIQFPTILSGLVTLLPSLPGWNQVTVYDSQPVTRNAPATYCTVGFTIPDEDSGTCTTDQHPNGFQYIEQGDIFCRLVARTGKNDLPGMRTQAFGLLSQLDAAIREDRTLGLIDEGGFTLTVAPRVTADDKGTAVALIFTVSYYTVT